jgi:iron complex outermembrane receptor protein
MLRRTAFLCSFFCICTASLLIAESLPDYVVTASRESEEILDTPADVSVITAEEIAATGETSVVAVLEKVAGVTFSSYSTDAQAQVSMRGFGENSFGRVVVLVDGRRLNNPDMSGINWLSIPSSSIDRIEIVDGPSGVLYGSGAVGGVINIITKEGASGLNADAALSYGSFNTMRAQASAGYGVDRAGFLVSADYYKTDGYRDRSANSDVNAVLNGFVDLTDLVTIRPSFTYSNIAYQMPGALTQLQFQADPRQAVNQADAGAEKNLGGGLVSAWKATNWLSLELPLNYVYKERLTDTTSWSAYSSIAQHQFEAKPKATVNADTPIGALSAVCGADVTGSVHTQYTWADSDYTNLSSEYQSKQISYAPYASGSLVFAGVCSLDAGIRYDLNTLASSNVMASKEYAKNSNALVYEVSFNYRPADAFSVYAKHNTLYRFPFIDEILTYGVFLDDLEPETGYNFEVGAKFRPGRFLSVSASAYYMLMDHEIAYNMATYRNENLDRTQRIGGKAEIGFVPAEFVELNANVAYVRATFAAGDNAGKYVPLVPSLTAGGDVRFLLPYGISAGGDVSWTGESFQGGDTTNTSDKIASYMLLGATARIEPPVFKGKLAVFFRADNLLDSSYAPLVYFGGYYPAPGRSLTIGALVKY